MNTLPSPEEIAVQLLSTRFDTSGLPNLLQDVNYVVMSATMQEIRDETVAILGRMPTPTLLAAIEALWVDVRIQQLLEGETDRGYPLHDELVACQELAYEAWRKKHGGPATPSRDDLLELAEDQPLGLHFEMTTAALRKLLFKKPDQPKL